MKSNYNIRKTNNSSKRSLNWFQIIPSVIGGLILGIGATLITQGQKITKLETQMEKFNNIQLRDDNSEKLNDEIIQTESNPDDLVSIIKQKQSTYVKESSGKESYECFTDEDYKKFIDSKVPEKISENLKKDNRFIDIVLAIKDMPISEWQKLKELCLQTFKPTWAEQGHIDKNGQTNAGQKAEREIAKTIVNLAVELLNKSTADIKKLYTY